MSVEQRLRDGRAVGFNVLDHRPGSEHWRGPFIIRSRWRAILSWLRAILSWRRAFIHWSWRLAVLIRRRAVLIRRRAVLDWRHVLVGMLCFVL